MGGEDVLVAGRYRLLERVGRGGMGIVWRAHDEHLDRVVAVKRLRSDGVGDEDFEAVLDRTMREARVAARIAHPHAITVHDVVVDQGAAFLVMEFLPCRSLSALVAETGPLSPVEAAAIGAQVASALAAAHAEGIVHCDVKPGNVLVTDDGIAKIADFGISRAEGLGPVFDRGLVAGTPAYLAPEVAEGGRGGAASDVFSLGATLFWAVEGVPPFGDPGNTVALLVRITHSRPEPFRRAGVLGEPLRAMLRRDPAERPTMRQVQNLLEAIAAGRPADPPGSVDTRPLTVVSARTVRRVAIGGVVAAVVVSAGMALSRDADTDRSGAIALPGTSDCVAELRVLRRWDGGYEGEVVVRPVDTEVDGWVTRWSPPRGHEVTEVWNGTASWRGDEVRVRDVGWNAVLGEGRVAVFGFLVQTSPDADRMDDGRIVLPCRAD